MKWENPSTNQIEDVVVVAGGRDLNGNLRPDVELLFLNQEIGLDWVNGPNLTARESSSKMIEFGNNVILIGGEGGDGRHLYQLSSPNGSWIKMKQTLKVPRLRHVAHS